MTVRGGCADATPSAPLVELPDRVAPLFADLVAADLQRRCQHRVVDGETFGQDGEAADAFDRGEGGVDAVDGGADGTDETGNLRQGSEIVGHFVACGPVPHELRVRDDERDQVRMAV